MKISCNVCEFNCISNIFFSVRAAIKNVPSEHLIYVKPEHYGSEEVVRIDPIVLNKENDTIVPVILNTFFMFNHLVSTAPPRSIRNNSAFLVDLDKFEDAGDLLCDYLGSWMQTKTSTKKYSIYRMKSRYMSSVSI